MPDTYSLTDVALTSHLVEIQNRIKRELDKVAATVEPNVIEAITIDGTPQTVTNKTVALDLSDYAKKIDVASGVRVKGSVANFAALPANAEVGDMYNVQAGGGTDINGVAIKAGDNVVKTATGWDNFGGTVDLSNYVEKVTGKQLSTEDFTTAEKTKLGGISAGAQVNVIETVKLNGTALTPDANKAVNIDISGKIDKVTNAGLSHIAIFDANGALVDSGHGFASDADITAMINSIFGVEQSGG